MSQLFFQRQDSWLHAGAGLVTALSTPWLAVGYIAYQSQQDASCNTFVQGCEYAVGYLLGQLVFMQLFPQLAQ